jgi:hypothetical protein
MTRKLLIAVIAAASMAAACTSAPTEPSVTEARALEPRLDEVAPPPQDTIKRCGGMLGSGTVVAC